MGVLFLARAPLTPAVRPVPPEHLCGQCDMADQSFSTFRRTAFGLDMNQLMTYMEAVV
jgi:hypothetical protein